MDDIYSLVSKIDEFAEIHNVVNDNDLDEALSFIVKLMGKPDVPPVQAVPLIVKLQATAAKMSLLATYYTYVDKGPAGSVNYKKKNLYYSMAEALNKIVDALKYTVRYNVV